MVKSQLVRNGQVDLLSNHPEGQKSREALHGNKNKSRIILDPYQLNPLVGNVLISNRTSKAIFLFPMYRIPEIRVVRRDF